MAQIREEKPDTLPGPFYPVRGDLGTLHESGGNAIETRLKIRHSETQA